MVAASSLEAWILASRPRTLVRPLIPVGVATVLSLSIDSFSAWWITLPLVFAFSLSLVANLHNDLCDGLKGHDTPNRLGPPRALASGWLSTRELGISVLVLLCFALVIAGFMTYRAPYALLVALICFLGVLSYTGGKRPLSHMGLGPLLAGVFYGPVAVMMTCYLQIGRWPLESLWLGLASGVHAIAMMEINNIRDLPEDRLTGKRTLPVRFGERFARWEIAVTHVIPLIVSVMCGWWGALLALPHTVLFLRRLPTVSGREWNEELGQSALISSLWAIGVAISIWFTRS